MSTKCKSCGQSIIWTITSTGRKLPVNNDKEGLPHWATCPDADMWRNKK